MAGLALFLVLAAGLGLATIAAQHLALRAHLRQASPVPLHTPPVSILKPLCGVDDALEANLASFASLDYPAYEVVLGVRSRRDPAWRIACGVARRWPRRFRVVIQRGEPGLNPKVNQLVTLARAARHDILVVSDSNVRVSRGYLAEVVALLEDERVGLVTHPISGVGEARLGSLMDHLHLTGSIAPGVVGAKRIARRDFVVGKSMALRRSDLRALGGFEAVKDVLAEDYVLGCMIGSVLGKRVTIAHRPVENVSTGRTLAEFAARYRRWAVLQRQAVGPVVYACQILLNPIVLAATALGVARTRQALTVLVLVCVAKAALDGAAARALRPGGFSAAQLAVVPLKDIVLGSAWLYGLLRRDVEWRGRRLLVTHGTRIEAQLACDAPVASPGEMPAVS
jgi:ceramide glucosyltransferase